MLLAIDAGNTQTVLGLWDLDAVPGNGGLVAHWRVSTESARTADELAMLVSQLLSQRGYQMPDAVSGVAISST
ncbi:MAG: type III pantothenate kinase, partial [Acidimicrobiales bacterium]